MIVTKHHDPLLDQDVGKLLVPAQVLPEPVTDEHCGPHNLVWAGAPVASEQLVTSGSVSYEGSQVKERRHQSLLYSSTPRGAACYAMQFIFFF